MKKTFLSNKKGFVTLISVVIVSAIGLVIVLGLLTSSIDSGLTTLTELRTYQAKTLVSACLGEALQRINDSTPYTGTASMAFQYGNCMYEVTNTGAQTRSIRASSTVDRVVRKALVTIDQINPSIHITSWQQVSGF